MSLQRTLKFIIAAPPLMNKAVEKMALDYGVPPENIRFDDFGE
jgi:Na+-transporting NADH:ubiquinone oxidoreductase subunit F